MQPASAPATILGNRRHAKTMPNFDACDMKERAGDDLIPLAVIKKVTAGKLPPAKKQPLLVIETLRIREQPADTLVIPDIMPSESDLREYEKEFMKYVYPLRNSKFTHLFLASADPATWSYASEKPAPYSPYKRPPSGFEYHNYCTAGIFAFAVDDDLLPVDKIYPRPRFNPETEQIWMRVWYKQVWDGFIMTDAFPPTALSDECLVHVALELGLREGALIAMTRAEVWHVCYKEINARYFKEGRE